MKFIYQLILLRFVSPKTLFLFARAKKTHGNNLCFLLKLSAESCGNKTAIADEHQKLSFAELYKKVNQISCFLKKNIIAKDTATVVLACNNTVSNIVFLHAIQNIGLKIILVNHKAHINDIKRFTDDKTYFIFSSEASHLSLINAYSIDEIYSNCKIDSSGFIPSKKYAPVIFQTSGTTGNSKYIEKKNGAFYWLRTFAQFATYTGIYKKNAVYISIPVSHAFGYTALIFTLLLGKIAIISCSKNQQQISELIVTEKADLIVGVPSSLYQVADILKDKKHSVSLIISGGAPLNRTIFTYITEKLTSNIYSMYGSTEASTSFIADYDMLKNNIHSLGKPLKGVKYKLETLDDGSKELLIKSPLANLSSYKWLHSGDLAQTDNKGNLYWCGRKDNMILKNGVNIYPAEIEIALHHIDCIEDVYVTGEEDSLKGEIIIAYIKTKFDFMFDEVKIKSQLKEFLPSIKIPDKVLRVDEFSYTSTGKKVKPA